MANAGAGLVGEELLTITTSRVTRYVDQMNLNVPEHINENPDQNNVPLSTTLERAFFLPLARKRQIGMNLTYRF